MYSERKEEPELLDLPEEGDPFGPEKEITLEDHERNVNGNKLRWYHWLCILIWLVTAGVLGYVIPTYIINEENSVDNSQQQPSEATSKPSSSNPGPTFAPIDVTRRPSTPPPVGPPVTAAPSISLQPTAVITPNPTAAPSIAPVTGTPTITPVTSTPTIAPVTGTPTIAPVTAAPTIAPVTTGPITTVPTAQPSVSPTVQESAFPTLSPNSIREYIISVSKFGGTEFYFLDSYQSLALDWVTSQSYPIATQPDLTINEQALQLYALACLYFSTFAVPNDATDDVVPDGASIPGWLDYGGWLLSTDICQWYGIDCNSDGRVGRISLNQNTLTGKIPREIGYLGVSLWYLDIRNNLIANAGPEEHLFLGDLTKLNFLLMGTTYFQYDGVPDEIGLLTEIIEMDISYMLWYGDLMQNKQIWSNLLNLETLSLGGNSFNSPLPDELITLPNLKNLYADYSDITGDLGFIGKMTAIEELWIDHNTMTGEVLPATIGDSLTIKSLSFTDCKITGTIPGEMGGMTMLKQVWMSKNFLTGNIPATLGGILRLERLHVQGNDLTGSMPDEICNNRRPFGRIASLQADCDGEVTCATTCCTCCGETCSDNI